MREGLLTMDSKQKLRETLKSFFGFDTFKGQQEEIINNIYNGKNTFVIMPTGAGKSLCYQLPAIASEGTAIIISPLIALMKNQVDAIRAFSGTDGIAEFLNSSLNKAEIRRVKDNVTNGHTKLLFVAPESLGKLENIEFLQGNKISFVAVDEAHCISEWGHDFRPEYRKIKQMVQLIGDVPIIALTATATPKVQLDIMKNLQMSEATTFKSSFNRPNLYYEVRPKINATKSIIKYIKDHMGKSGIIYTLSRKKAEEIAETLVANGIKAAPYHAGLDSHVRMKNQDAFLMEEVDVIVATIAFGMGIDKPDVRFVIHYDIPKSIESYYQETGRAGRDGLEGVCIAYYNEKDILKLQKFMKDKPVSEKEIGHLLLNEVVAYAESGVCRRRQILHYFGEVYSEKNCNQMCDACRHPQPKEVVTAEMVLLLNTVKELVKKFDFPHVVAYLMGEITPPIEAYGHHRMASFGVGKEKGTRFWKSIIKVALFNNFLLKDIENYGLLKVGPLGDKYLADPYALDVPLDHDYEEAGRDEEIESQQSEALDTRLFDLLRELRKKMAKEKNLPPYVIFQDPSLEEMATNYPTNMAELQQISGVGPGKAMKFGKAFIELISKYVEENEIDRPADFVVKSTVNKSGVKVFIIGGIDRKIPLQELARSKNLSYDDILEEIKTIVDSGTKVNLDYHINEVMDEDLQEEVYDYFRTAASDDLTEAIRALGDDFSEEELKLVRIKFLSEQAN
jgi:ATP-dependent DNA helicase RecQ